MTTIAIGPTSVAFDEQLTINDDLILNGFKDKVRLRKNEIFCIAGVPIMDDLIEWWDTGCEPTEAPVAEWDLMVWDGHVWTSYSHERPYAVRLPLPYAMGTGSHYAMAALHLGYTPERAVRLAAELDPYTGSRVETFDYGD